MSPGKFEGPGGESGATSKLCGGVDSTSVASEQDQRESHAGRVYGRQLTLGEVVREEGIARGEQGTDTWWRSCVDEGIAELARRGVTFQAVDLLDLGVPEPDHPNRWGARLLAAARAGVIVPVGYAPSKRPTTACSAVRVWRGAAYVQGGDA